MFLQNIVYTVAEKQKVAVSYSHKNTNLKIMHYIIATLPTSENWHNDNSNFI